MDKKKKFKKNTNEKKEIKLNNKLILQQIHKIMYNLSSYQWTNVTFTDTFYSSIEFLNESIYQNIIEAIQSILNGNFSNTIEHIEYEDDFLYGTYFYSLNQHYNMLFIIYFKPIDTDSNEYIEQLDFLKVSNSVTDLKDEINTFVDQYKDQYKGIEFDRIGLLDNSNILFYRVKTVNNKTIKLPHYSIDKRSERIAVVTISGKDHRNGFNLSIFDLEKTLKDVYYMILKSNPS